MNLVRRGWAPRIAVKMDRGAEVYSDSWTWYREAPGITDMDPDFCKAVLVSEEEYDRLVMGQAQITVKEIFTPRERAIKKLEIMLQLGVAVLHTNSFGRMQWHELNQAAEGILSSWESDK